MKPIKEYFQEPNLDIGGATVTLTGPPGCGKTNSLIQLAIMRLNEGQKVLWRSTKQCQWAGFLANDVEVTFWLHDSIEDVDAWLSKKSGVEDLELDSVPGLTVKRFSDPEQLVSDLDSGVVNAVQVPGLNGEKFERYFFKKTWIDILEALANRKDVANPISFFTDEGGDIWPCQQQLKKPFYSLVVERTPPLLSQLRKQMVFLYIAAHSTHDLHYFVWKIKGNTIGYMSNANVKNNLHQEVDQSIVNKLSRGEIVVPPMDRDRFMLANEAEDLSWVDGGKFRIKLESDIPDLINDGDDDSSNSKLNRAQAAAKLYEETSYTQSKAADIYDVSQSAISKELND